VAHSINVEYDNAFSSSSITAIFLSHAYREMSICMTTCTQLFSALSESESVWVRSEKNELFFRRSTARFTSRQ